MATIDLSLIRIFCRTQLLLVFTVTFAVLAKYKVLGESKFVNLLIAFITATIL